MVVKHGQLQKHYKIELMDDQLLLKDTDFYIHDLKTAMINKDEWRRWINQLK